MQCSKNKHVCKTYDNFVDSADRLIEFVKDHPVLYETSYARKRGLTLKTTSKLRKSAWETIGHYLHRTPGTYTPLYYFE